MKIIKSKIDSINIKINTQIEYKNKVLDVTCECSFHNDTIVDLLEVRVKPDPNMKNEIRDFYIDIDNNDYELFNQLREFVESTRTPE